MKVEYRQKHLDLLEEITNSDQLSVNDIVVALIEAQLPKGKDTNTEAYGWDWNISGDIVMVEDVQEGYVRFRGIKDYQCFKNHYYFDVEKNNINKHERVVKVYRANPFHVALALTYSYIENRFMPGHQKILLPYIPEANECDFILVTLLTKHLDVIMKNFQGFKDLDTAVGFHKAFRSWDVISYGHLDANDGTLDCIVYDAFAGSKLFYYFFNTFVLGGFLEKGTKCR